MDTKKQENKTISNAAKIVTLILSLIVFWGVSNLLPEAWAMLLVALLPDCPNEIKLLLFTAGNLIITAAAALPLFCLCMRFPLKEIKTLFRKPVEGSMPIMLYLVLGVAITLPVGLVQAALLLMGSITSEMLEVGTGAALLSLILQSIVVMPVVEEIMFRGVVIKNLKGCKHITIIIVSTLAFAVGHMNPVNLLIALPAGVVLAVVRLRTGSIRDTVILHIIVNICGMLLWPFILTLLS